MRSFPTRRLLFLNINRFPKLTTSCKSDVFVFNDHKEKSDLHNVPRGRGQKSPLAQRQAGSSSGEEVGLEGLEGSNVVYLHLFIHTGGHHVPARRRTQRHCSLVDKEETAVHVDQRREMAK